MAMPNGISNFAPKLQIEAVQTVPPERVTDPRELCQLLVTEPIGPEIFQGCFNIVLYYNKATEDDSGWLVAGWIKESLGRILREQPLLSGRLRRGEDGKGKLEIVSNDSGARLIEAKVTLTLKEFLDLKEKEKFESELVFWNEIDEQNPQFSPLLYVQVTNFQCGGYSIGISCSLLLADLLIMDNFLLRWANIQKDIISKNDGKKEPIFYFPSLKATSLFPTGFISSTPIKSHGKTMIFKIISESVDLKNESCKTLALLGIEEAESKLASNFSLQFPLLVKKSPKVLKIQNYKRHNLLKSYLNLKSAVTFSSWDDLGLNKVAFREGNKPAQVSYWIGLITDGFVMAIPSSIESPREVNIIVTVPYEKDI